MALAGLLAHAQEYLALALSSLAAGGAAGFLLGAIASRSNGLRAPLLTLGNVARVVPSLAVLTFMLPLLGVGFAPAFCALALLATAPVLINTDVAFRSVPAETLEAADAMGMTAMQRFVRVEWPLAAPVAFVGFRTASTEVIASA